MIVLAVVAAVAVVAGGVAVNVRVLDAEESSGVGSLSPVVEEPTESGAGTPAISPASTPVPRTPRPRPAPARTPTVTTPTTSSIDDHGGDRPRDDRRDDDRRDDNSGHGGGGSDDD